jgi:hypothetical protein
MVITGVAERAPGRLRRLVYLDAFCAGSGYGETAARVRAEGWDHHELETKHMAMLTAPEELAELLDRIART